MGEARWCLARFLSCNCAEIVGGTPVLAFVSALPSAMHVAVSDPQHPSDLPWISGFEVAVPLFCPSGSMAGRVYNMDSEMKEPLPVVR